MSNELVHEIKNMTIVLEELSNQVFMLRSELEKQRALKECEIDYPDSVNSLIKEVADHLQ